MVEQGLNYLFSGVTITIGIGRLGHSGIGRWIVQ
jgi:hypothetical protein